MPILLAFALLAQGASAEETFKKIEEAFRGAKSLRVKFRLEGHGAKEGPDRDIRANGTVLLKEGDRVRMEIRVLAGGQEHEMTIVSDGAKLRSARDGRDAGAVEPPKNFRAAVDVGTARMGPFVAVMFGITRSAKEVEESPDKLMSVRDLKAGEADAQGQTLTYTIRMKEERDTVDVKLWYDAKSLRPAKREIVVKKGGEAQGTLVETYEEYALDVDLPDDSFRTDGGKPQGDKKEDKK